MRKYARRWSLEVTLRMSDVELKVKYMKAIT